MTLGNCNNGDTTVVFDVEYRVVMLRCDIFLKIYPIWLNTLLVPLVL